MTKAPSRSEDATKTISSGAHTQIQKSLAKPRRMMTRFPRNLLRRFFLSGAGNDAYSCVALSTILGYAWAAFGLKSLF